MLSNISISELTFLYVFVLSFEKLIAFNCQGKITVGTTFSVEFILPFPFLSTEFS